MSKSSTYIYSLLVVLFLSIVGCGEDTEDSEKEELPKEPELTEAQLDSIRIDSLRNYHENKFPAIDYTTLKIENDSAYREFRKKYYQMKDAPDAHKVFITMNRREFRYVRIGDTVIYPDTIIDDMRAYSVFPQYYPEAEGVDKLVLVSNEYQCYAAYENGVQVRFAAANTGKERTQTYPGRYSLVWKQKERVSSLNSDWKLPYNFNFHRLAGNAFHQFEMPGRPVSHSCVRQFMSDAEWLFNWGEQADYSEGAPKEFTGTPVLIIDAFDFNRKQYGKWVDLENNKQIIIDLPDKPLDYELPFIPIEQVPKTSRGSIPKDQRERYKHALDSLYARGTLREGVTIIPSIDYNKLREEKKRKKEEEAEKKRLEEEKKKELDEEGKELLEERIEEEIEKVKK